MIVQKYLGSIVEGADTPSTVSEMPFFDPALTDLSATGRASRVCALFELTYATEGFFALASNTCDQRAAGALYR